jgi:hypothetical protein
MVSEVSRSQNARYCRFYCLWNQVMQTTEEWLTNTSTVYAYKHTSGKKLHKTLLSLHFWSLFRTQCCMKICTKCFSCLKKCLAKSTCIYNYVKVTEMSITWMTQTGFCGLVKRIITKMLTCFMMATARYIIYNRAKSHYRTPLLWLKPELQKT